jgi:flagellar basal body-associated protein FliL
VLPDEEVRSVAAWVWILLIILLVLVLFGGVGYSRR